MRNQETYYSNKSLILLAGKFHPAAGVEYARRHLVVGCTWEKALIALAYFSPPED